MVVEVEGEEEDDEIEEGGEKVSALFDPLVVAQLDIETCSEPFQIPNLPHDRLLATPVSGGFGSLSLSLSLRFCSSFIAATIHSSFPLGQLVVNQAISNHGHVSDCLVHIAVTNSNASLIRWRKKLALIKQFNNICSGKRL